MLSLRTVMALCTAVSGMLTPVAVCSQSDPDPPETHPVVEAPGMSLSDALSRAAARSPEALAPLARTALADSEVPVAGMLMNPLVRMGMLAAPVRLQGNVVVTLPVFGQRAAAIRVAEAGAAAARWDLARARLDIRTATATAWLDLWLAQRSLVNTTETSVRRERLVSITQERLTAGTAPELDALRARAEAARARADRGADERTVVALGRRLSAWLGDSLGASTTAHAVGELPGESPPPAWERLQARLDEHPALEAERARVTELHRRVDLERRQRLPLLAFDFGVDEWNTDGLTPPALVGGVTVEVPVFHNHGALIDRAEAALAVQGAEGAAARARLAADLASAVADYEGAAIRARAEIQEVLPVAQRAADLAVEGYSAGRGDIQSVISAEQALTDARMAADQALAARALAWVRLEAAVGSPL